ncbi:Pkinase-domain-containing protein [Pluteus cervinus]|uniref:Pkinase-domain-containing protein n=1 Tax=Pluteus cervinus TaxID=181527 RepID=A0ACD3BGC6_9AGAR|nr:Pkinase-domain-containing protein [Pluteus cervinus]
MPPGVSVVETFKNLIRHGKHHQQARNDLKQTAAQPPSQAQPNTSDHQELPQNQRQDQQRHHQDQQRQTHVPATTAARDAAAEIIVNEEREAKLKMPSYKGLENYKLLEKMGDGAFSNVYKAIDISTGQKVAVKVVRKFELNASQAGEKHLNAEFKKKPRVTERANILKEVQIMRGTNHPSIVKLISFSESQEHYFLVLELMEGGELFHQIVKLTYFSENLARHVILQVAQGIRYLHEERGVVHRDIKPENLLFERIPIVPSKVPVNRPYDEDKEDEGEFVLGVGGGGIGRVKIADFGLSKVVWNEHTMTPCGTVGYTAPEIVKDERYSKSVDMWALGCVLYTLLCGFPPFYDESINVLTEKVARGHYTFLSPWWDDISDSAKNLITHLLCVDPSQRFTIDEFLQHPWCTALSTEQPVSSSIPNAGSQPLDSPLLSAIRGGWAQEGRSPGVASLKEAFDITYAVHRMEEEGARRRKFRAAGARGFLSGLNEEEDEGLDPSPLPAANRQAGQRDQGHLHKDTGTKGIRAQHGFELDLDGATLLGRRNKRALGNKAPNAFKPMGPPTGPNSNGQRLADS